VPSPQHRDIVIVGAGAAGLATAIFTRQRAHSLSVLVLDGAPRPGAKILVSGGSRCNVTNTVVTERDYWGGPSSIVRRVLRAFPATDAVAFFARAGVALHEEPDGKLFPDSNRARDVLDALLRQLTASGAELLSACRVTAVTRQDDGFRIATSRGEFMTPRVVLATGGQSLPKSGSDGAGYAMAQALGHTLVPTTPALAPLRLDAAGEGAIHTEIPGVSLDTALTLWVDGAVAIRLRGALLWTHFGISGPVVLNLSRHWLRAKHEGHDARATANFIPDMRYEDADRFWLDECRDKPRGTLAAALSRLLPASMADAVVAALRLDGATLLGHLPRDDRRRLVHALVEWPLPIVDSRGYNYAEVTAGGIDLREINPATMESRVCPGLYLVGEIVDVDGRLGGFNFQWSWSSAFVAAKGLARDLGTPLALPRPGGEQWRKR
jgi:predicted Rossmann fold flavoprotein